MRASRGEKFASEDELARLIELWLTLAAAVRKATLDSPALPEAVRAILSLLGVVDTP